MTPHENFTAHQPIIDVSDALLARRQHEALATEPLRLATADHLVAETQRRADSRSAHTTRLLTLLAAVIAVWAVALAQLTDSSLATLVAVFGALLVITLLMVIDLARVARAGSHERRYRRKRRRYLHPPQNG